MRDDYGQSSEADLSRSELICVWKRALSHNCRPVTHRRDYESEQLKGEIALKMCAAYGDYMCIYYRP